MRARSHSTGSSRLKWRRNRSKLQSPWWWDSSAPRMSNGVASAGTSSGSATKTNSASGSRNRRISQAHAARSMWQPARVAHLIASAPPAEGWQDRRGVVGRLPPGRWGSPAHRHHARPCCAPATHAGAWQRLPHAQRKRKHEMATVVAAFGRWRPYWQVWGWTRGSSGCFSPTGCPGSPRRRGLRCGASCAVLASSSFSTGWSRCRWTTAPVSSWSGSPTRSARPAARPRSGWRRRARWRRSGRWSASSGRLSPASTRRLPPLPRPPSTTSRRRGVACLGGCAASCTASPPVTTSRPRSVTWPTRRSSGSRQPWNGNGPDADPLPRAGCPGAASSAGLALPPTAGLPVAGGGAEVGRGALGVVPGAEPAHHEDQQAKADHPGHEALGHRALAADRRAAAVELVLVQCLDVGHDVVDPLDALAVGRGVLREAAARRHLPRSDLDRLGHIQRRHPQHRRTDVGAAERRAGAVHAMAGRARLRVGLQAARHVALAGVDLRDKRVADDPADVGASAWISCSLKRGLLRAIASPVVDWKGIRPVRTAQSTAAAPPRSFSEGTVEYSDGPFGLGPWQAAQDWR